MQPIPAWEASLSVLGTPVVAILTSRLTFGEQFKTGKVIGMALIGGGVAWCNSSPMLQVTIC